MQRFHKAVYLVMMLSSSCAVNKMQQSEHVTISNKMNAPSFAELKYWAAHPDKTDPSDQSPVPLGQSIKKDTSSDVFFIHPTTLTDYNSLVWNADIDDEALNDKTDQSTILYQASVFNEYRVFSPRYRQAHIRSYFTEDTVNAKKAFDIAYEDVKRAFIFYLENHNNQRPIILASHSQGSSHAMRLLSEFFDGKDLGKKLIIAYIVGMKIPGDQFREFSLCKDSLQTGCFAAWRTFREGYLPDYVPKETGPSFVTNPLTWTTTNEYAPRNLNKGGVLRNFNKIFPAVADAQIENRVLWVKTLHFPGSMFLRMKNFHVADINLFYMNIRENLRARVRSYFAARPYIDVQ